MLVPRVACGDGQPHSNPGSGRSVVARMFRSLDVRSRTYTESADESAKATQSRRVVSGRTSATTAGQTTDKPGRTPIARRNGRNHRTGDF
jgi:hypothetical protein